MVKFRGVDPLLGWVLLPLFWNHHVTLGCASTAWLLSLVRGGGRGGGPLGAQLIAFSTPSSLLLAPSLSSLCLFAVLATQGHF